MDNRGVDTDPGWVNRKLRELERAIQDQRSERRAAATTVGSGNWIIDGGDVLMLDVDGSVIFRLGDQQHGDRGVSILRDNGAVAFQVRKPFSPNDDQQIYIFDRYGNFIFAETTFGSGLEKPYLDIPLQPVGGTVAAGPFGLERTVTSATFEDVFRWQGIRQNQWYRPVFNVRCSAADTAAEIRVVNAAGTTLSRFLQPGWVGGIAAGSTTDQELKPPSGLELDSAFDTTQVVRVQVRRTAGTGTVAIAVRQSQGGSA